MKSELLYEIALTLVPNIGCVHARTLIEKFGSARQVFHAPVHELTSAEGIGLTKATSIHGFTDFSRAEKELHFIGKQGIRPLFITHPHFPKRLLNCYDAPAMLYSKGEADLNASKMVAIVGSRNHTEYGRQLTEKLVAALAPYQITIISGLAFGIDAIAHKAALKNNLPTIGVLAHGLDLLYPSQHISLAKEMLTNGGGLLTEFRSQSIPDKFNFPARNRIVAGMSDATIVIETGIPGGSMITAELANSYNRDVFAFPGRTTDSKSEGCNQLIRNNKATLLTNAAELIDCLNWGEQRLPARNKQRILFPDLNENEQKIITILTEKDAVHIDEINIKTNLSSSTVAAAVLSLELRNVIVSLPGKIYQLA